jgi:peptidoglycan hydrolase-like protein with peptidoglycan-binding domain
VRVALVVLVVLLAAGVFGLADGAVAGASTPPPGPNAVLGFGASAAIASGARPAGPVAGIASTPDGGGYWTVSSAGAVTAEGDAVAYGSLVGTALTAPVVGMAATHDGHGYWLVASDGGIFAFGDAVFHGSMGGHVQAAPVVGMAATPDGGGYWLVASDGGIFSFGDAVFHGSMGGHALDEPMVGMAATPDGGGYWTVAADGGIFSFGDAPFVGSGTGGSVEAPAVAMSAGPGGYWVAYSQTAPASSVLGQQQLLAILGYLPLEWTPAGFVWRWPSDPPTLKAQWVPGEDTVVTRGAITAFEAHVGLPLDGNISPIETADLEAAAADPAAGANPDGYTYALANENLPETLTVWHDGAVINVSPANTGGPGAATALGTWPVYERLRAQIMTGTDPDGASYADPVQWVAYFHGSDAVHYIARATYGSPQSLGCVELPYASAAFLWPYLTYGTLVTVV